MDVDTAHFTFLVNDEPFCLWDPDPGKRTNDFLDSIDPGYFSYLAESHAEHLDSAEHKRRVATAARMAYLHGVETLMTLIGAAVQAPQAPYAWVSLAKTDLLRSVIDRISKGDTSLHTELVHWDRTWEGLAQRVFSNTSEESGWQTTKANSFGHAWRIFGNQFLDDTNQQEYNSLKHGFRIGSSGFKIAFGLQHQHGVPPPREEMKYLGGSDNGSTFFVLERAGPDSPGTRSKRSRRRSVNWEPETMIRGLQVIDVSIRNIIAFMRILNGAQPSLCQFHYLEGVEDLSILLADSVSVRSSSFDTLIPDSEIRATTKQELQSEIAKTFSQPESS
jgi:hypothetical protein